MPRYLQETFVTPNNLPISGVIMRTESSVKDMEGRIHVAYIIRWVDTVTYEERISAFDTVTGEYLGESF